MTFDSDMPEVTVEIVEDSPTQDSLTNDAPEMESSTDPVESMEEEMLEEEHLFDESEEEYQGADDAPAQPVRKYALRKRTKLTVEHTNSGDQPKFDTTDDSEDEGVTMPKFVYSWKELYQPKQSKPAKPKAVTRKILEHLPKPTFVPHTCYICNTSYEDAGGLDTHLEGHVDLLPYKCETCSTAQLPQEFKTLIALNKHLQTHLYPYQCDYCPIRKLRMATYEEHMRRYHGYQLEVEGFTCDYCGQHFTNKKVFTDHRAKHRILDEGKYKCEHCGKVFCSTTVLVRHRRIHTGEMPFECKKCGKKFNHRDNFKHHMRTHINEKGYICSECGKSFTAATTLRYHMAEHFPDDPNYRPQPQAQRNVVRPRFNQKDANSEGNVSTADNKSRGEKIFECKFEGCDHVTTSRSSYYYHKAMHEKKFQCQLCQNRFPTNAHLQQHIATVHEGLQPEKTLGCQYCGKMFSSKQKLNIHIDVHENNRRHKCRFCEKAFVQKNNLTAHERIHTGERPYPCRMCSQVFITSSMRSKHESTHRGGGGGVQTETQEYECENFEDIIEELNPEQIDEYDA